jgi:hypothetical protein
MKNSVYLPRTYHSSKSVIPVKSRIEYGKKIMNLIPVYHDQIDLLWCRVPSFGNLRLDRQPLLLVILLDMLHITTTSIP